MTRELISFTFDPRDMLLSLQMGFSFVRAAVACAILERTSGLEPSSATTAPRYLKLVTVPNTCSTWLISQESWVRYPVWQHTFVSPSAFSRRAVVSYWRKYVHEVLVNRLGGLSLPRKSVVRLTDRPDMTLDVYRGRKTTIQQPIPALPPYLSLDAIDTVCHQFGLLRTDLHLLPCASFV